MTICVNLVNMIVLIDPNISCMNLILKNKIRKSKCFFIYLVSLFWCNFIIFYKKLLLYLITFETFYTYLHPWIYLYTIYDYFSLNISKILLISDRILITKLIFSFNSFNFFSLFSKSIIIFIFKFSTWFWPLIVFWYFY